MKHYRATAHFYFHVHFKKIIFLASSLVVAGQFQNTTASEQNLFPKEIYGVDYRMDVKDVMEEDILEMAVAVGGIVFSDQLTRMSNGDYLLDLEDISISNSNGNAYPLCPDERFSDQQVLPFCTAFLVASNIMITAGHCLDTFQPDEVVIIFGFQVDNFGQTPEVLPASNVYFVDEIIHVVNNFLDDYAIFRLNRSVPSNVNPLRYRRIGKVPGGTPIGVIGHPLGLPLKIAFGEDTRVYNNTGLRYFSANFDASAGNSGSPVINQLTGAVEGIYIYSTINDLAFNNNCWNQNYVESDEAAQGVFRISRIAQLINQAIEDSVEEKIIPACGARDRTTKIGLYDFILMLSLGLFLLCVNCKKMKTKQ